MTFTDISSEEPVDNSRLWGRMLFQKFSGFSPIETALLTSSVNPFEEDLDGLIKEVCYLSKIMRYPVVVAVSC